MSSIIQNEDGTYTERRPTEVPTVNPESTCGQISLEVPAAAEPIADQGE